MSLGWLNLQDYLGANEGNLDGQAQQLDERAYAMPEGRQSMPYGEFLARRRQRNDESGAAALLGGDATDVMLARKGKSYAAPNTFDPAAKARQDADNRRKEADYWEQQKQRNAGISQRDADSKRQQQERFDSSRRAMGQTSGYGRYSNAVGKSFDDARNKQVRTISEEEYSTWTR
jgi:hypothetical protein